VLLLLLLLLIIDHWACGFCTSTCTLQ